MLRFAAIKDDTYVPYAKTNRELTIDTNNLENDKMTWTANSVLGAKNLIPYPYRRKNGYTTNGITFSVTEEGIVTANGTASNTAYFTG